jgi:glycerol-3-phosphate O-acyltransferase / dihydroxyacetone phosphate acyltransferase
MPSLYSGVEFFAWYSCNLFFRDITVVNQENIPLEGPTIIYGNHNNQFVDGMVLTSPSSSC